MKKSFFKKLSVVLAAAMVVTAASPATSAFAAAAPKLNATSKTLHLDVDGKNEYDFNIKNKKSGWKYLWESSNEDVAVVNAKNGVVTATGAGTAKVTVSITDKKGAEVADLRATVTVRDNIKELTITNKPEGDKLAVGKENDFNRSFVTVSKNTKKTSGITRWSVEPADGATINDSGVFVATKAGEYTITARAFQSKAKYNTWKANPAANEALVTAKDSYKVTVAASIVDVKQLDATSFKVEFDSAVADLDKNLAVSQLVGTTKVGLVVKEIKMSDDNKTATVKTYLPYTQKSTYVVDVEGIGTQNFVGATANVEDVAEAKVEGGNAEINTAKDIVVKLYNKDGVELTSIDSTLSSRVTVKSDNALNTYVDGANKKVYIYVKDAVAVVTATFHTYKYDTVGKEIGAIEAQGTYVGVEAAATNINGRVNWSINTTNFDNANQKIALGEDGRQLYVKYNTLTGTTASTIDNTGSYAGRFTFKSSNDNILYVSSTGLLYPVKEGTVTVVVSYGTGSTKTPIDTITITVGPQAKASDFTLSTYAFSLSNDADVLDGKNVTVKVTDQLGRAFSGATVVVAPYSATRATALLSLDTNGEYRGTTNSDGEVSIPFQAWNVVLPDGKSSETYTYKVTVGNITKYVNVTVSAPSSQTVSYYKLVLGSTSRDIKNSWEQSVSINLYAYASNGVANDKIDLTNADFKVEVQIPDNNATKVTITNPNYALVTAAGSKLEKAVIGTYNVVAYKKNVTSGEWYRLDSAQFAVTDSSAKPVYAGTKTLKYTVSGMENIVLETLKITYNGTDIKDITDGSVVIDRVNAVGVGNSVDGYHIKSVDVRVYTDSTHTTYYVYTVNTNVVVYPAN